MEVVRSCRCCLGAAADKDLTTPYTHLGRTEVYADMLKECFDLHLWVSGPLFSGICSDCVRRLRAASDFKLQVQRSQVELLGQLQSSRLDQDEETPIKIKAAEEDESDKDSLQIEKISKDAEPRQCPSKVRFKRPGRGPRATATRGYSQCHDCGKTLKDKKAISRHIQYNCPTGALTAYNKTHRRADMVLKDCRFCTYRSKNARNLYHHEMKHIGEKPYQCTHCDYKTGRKADFERHQSIHLGSKPFKCDYCNYSCIQKHTLMVHKRIHTGEKPYKCKQCDARFLRVQCFQKHVKKHNRDAFEVSSVRIAVRDGQIVIDS